MNTILLCILIHSNMELSRQLPSWESDILQAHSMLGSSFKPACGMESIIWTSMKSREASLMAGK
jgi:hypothetical protein